MARVAFFSLVLLATISCHARIVSFRRRHNMSYFSNYRQNIATASQTLNSIYLNIFLSFSTELVFLFVTNGYDMVNLQMVIILHNFINMIILPVFCFFSTRTEFRDLWAKETIFWRYRKRTRRAVLFSRNLAAKEARSPYVRNTDSFPGHNMDDYAF